MQDMVKMIMNPMMRPAPQGKVTPEMTKMLIDNMPEEGNGRTSYKAWAASNWCVALSKIEKSLREHRAGR